ncbi:MAG TPA: DmsE family decaheme c-type cytochrome [Rhodocyclaceae bacterium]
MLPSLRFVVITTVIALLPLGKAIAASEKSLDEAADILMTGDAVCTRCHNDVSDGIVDDYPVLSIGRTRHGVAADQRTPTCVACHGQSQDHIDNKREPGSGKRGQRPAPDFPFGKNAAATGKAHNDSCLACHAGDKLMHWNGSIHARRDVPCSDCHKMHVAQDPAMTREKLPEMCMSCHKEKRAQFARPNHHPVPEGQMVCTDCHNPHGSAGPKLMVKDSVNDTCYSCHMDYRGPFLCQQCHEPANHRGNFPSLNGANANSPGSGGLTQARGCVNCHTNLHGGNNPTNALNTRSFRR